MKKNPADEPAPQTDKQTPTFAPLDNKKLSPPIHVIEIQIKFFMQQFMVSLPPRWRHLGTDAAREPPLPPPPRLRFRNQERNVTSRCVFSCWAARGGGRGDGRVNVGGGWGMPVGGSRRGHAHLHRCTYLRLLISVLPFTFTNLRSPIYSVTLIIHSSIDLLVHLKARPIYSSTSTPHLSIYPFISYFTSKHRPLTHLLSRHTHPSIYKHTHFLIPSPFSPLPHPPV